MVKSLRTMKTYGTNFKYEHEQLRNTRRKESKISLNYSASLSIDSLIKLTQSKAYNNKRPASV